jgi:tetratricopeptide (TPR) repeat protein
MLAVTLVLALRVAVEPTTPPNDASADPEREREFQRLAQEAGELVQAGDFAGASALLEQAYDVLPRPEILFLRAEAERRGGHCRTSMELNRRFLESKPGGEARDGSRRSLELCRRALEQRGQAEGLHERGRHAEASAVLAEAYEVSPDPEILWRRGEMERAAGQCRVATALYDEYLEKEPEGPRAQAARDGVAACEHPAPSVVPGPAIEPDVDPTPPPPRQDRRGTPAWLRDPAGTSLSAVGAVVLATGLGLYFDARGRRTRAQDGDLDLGEYDRVERTTVLESGFGIGAMVGGSSLLVAGVSRWIVVGVRARKRGSARGGRRGLTGLFAW